MWNTIKKYFHEWLLTFSQNNSLFSSKKIERFIFMLTVISSIVSCVVYEIVKDKLTATEVTILTIPLLTAMGYNLMKTEEEKQNNKEESNNKENGTS